LFFHKARFLRRFSVWITKEVETSFCFLQAALLTRTANVLQNDRCHAGNRNGWQRGRIVTPGMQLTDLTAFA
jgi:hypothetical protein